MKAAQGAQKRSEDPVSGIYLGSVTAPSAFVQPLASKRPPASAHVSDARRSGGARQC